MPVRRGLTYLMVKVGAISPLSRNGTEISALPGVKKGAIGTQPLSSLINFLRVLRGDT